MQGGKSRRRKKGLFFSFFLFSKAHRELYLLSYFCLENLEAPEGSEEAEVWKKRGRGKRKRRRERERLSVMGMDWVG